MVFKTLAAYFFITKSLILTIKERGLLTARKSRYINSYIGVPKQHLTHDI